MTVIESNFDQKVFSFEESLPETSTLMNTITSIAVTALSAAGAYYYFGAPGAIVGALVGLALEIGLPSFNHCPHDACCPTFKSGETTTHSDISKGYSGVDRVLRNREKSEAILKQSLVRNIKQLENPIVPKNEATTVDSYVPLSRRLDSDVNPFLWA